GSTWRILNPQLKHHLLKHRKTPAKSEPRGAVTPQAVAALLAFGGRTEQGELHDAPRRVGSGIATESPSGAATAGVAAAALRRALRRCCFSCCRTFLASSLCLRTW